MQRAFVIAMECEAEAVRPNLRPDDRLYVSGVGKVNAAAAAMQAICEGASEIWNAGLAGGFGEGVEVGDVLAVGRAVEYDFDLAQLNGTAVGVLNEYDTPYLEVAPFEIPAASGIRGWATLATGDRFNDSDADNELIASVLGASLRDMEGGAIAHVCKRRGVPCHMVKCVSDVAGRSSMLVQYAQNRERCLRRLERALSFLRGEPGAARGAARD